MRRGMRRQQRNRKTTRKDDTACALPGQGGGGRRYAACGASACSSNCRSDWPCASTGSSTCHGPCNLRSIARVAQCCCDAASLAGRVWRMPGKHVRCVATVSCTPLRIWLTGAGILIRPAGNNGRPSRISAAGAGRRLTAAAWRNCTVAEGEGTVCPPACSGNLAAARTSHGPARARHGQEINGDEGFMASRSSGHAHLIVESRSGTTKGRPQRPSLRADGGCNGGCTPPSPGYGRQGMSPPVSGVHPLPRGPTEQFDNSPKVASRSSHVPSRRGATTSSGSRIASSTLSGGRQAAAWRGGCDTAGRPGPRARRSHGGPLLQDQGAFPVPRSVSRRRR